MAYEEPIAVVGEDAESAVAAMELAELGPVSFSDSEYFIRRIDDPEKAAEYIMNAVKKNRTFTVEQLPL